MIQRLLAAAIGLAVLLPAIIWGGELAVEIIIPVVMVACLLEYTAMAFPTERGSALGFMVVGVASVYGSAIYAPALATPAAAVVVIAAMIAGTLHPGPDLGRAADRVSRAVLGVGWISLLGALTLLRREDHGLAWIFVVLAVSWCGDTGGYFAGRFFGRHKLYPRVSPKKTWEGVAGGITLAVVGVLVVRAVGLPSVTVPEAAVLGAVLCIAGILGDLSESLLKRAFDVKDSGWIMPGHGGLLDRIDSVLFVAPLLYFWLQVRGS